MIYSIGYQGGLSLEQLRRIFEEKQVSFLVDVRSTPYGRLAEFNRKKLEAAFGIAYLYYGDRLGGFAEIQESAITDLVRLCQQKTLLLLCFELDPRKCHRHYEIARRLHAYGLTVTHLYKGDEIISTELEG